MKARDLSDKVKARATLALETSRATLALETSAHNAADKKRHDKRERHNDVCTYMFVIPIYMFAI